MACMEHACRCCGHNWFNNRRESYCPVCCSQEVTNWWDEESMRGFEDEEDEDSGYSLEDDEDSD